MSTPSIKKTARHTPWGIIGRKRKKKKGYKKHTPEGMGGGDIKGGVKGKRTGQKKTIQIGGSKKKKKSRKWVKAEPKERAS